MKNLPATKATKYLYHVDIKSSETGSLVRVVRGMASDYKEAAESALAIARAKCPKERQDELFVAYIGCYGRREF